MIAPLLLGLCAHLAPSLRPLDLQDDAPAAAPEAEGMRARLELITGRTFTGRVRFDAESGHLILRARLLGEDVAVDFAAVRSLERLNELARVVEPTLDADAPELLTLLRSQTLAGRVTGMTWKSIAFESVGFGPLELPRTDLGIWERRGEDRANEDPRTAEWRAWNLDSGVDAGEDGALLLPGFEAGLTREGTLAEQRIELSLEWRGVPEFRVVIGDEGADGRSGAVVLEPWGDHLVLRTWTPEGLRMAEAKFALAHDTGAILNLVVRGDSVAFDSFETFGGERVDVDAVLPLATAPDRLRIEGLGRPLRVWSCDIEALDAEVDPDGFVRVVGPLRGSEVDHFDADSGALFVDGGKARTRFADVDMIRFVPRDRTAELRAAEPRSGHGRVTLITGEVLEVVDVRVEGGLFHVDLATCAGGATVRLPLERVHRIALPQRSAETLTGDFQVGTDNQAPRASSVRAIERTDDGWRVRQSEPGFLTETASPVGERFEMSRATAVPVRIARSEFPWIVQLNSGESFPAKLSGFEDGVWSFRVLFVEEVVEVPDDDVEAILFEPRRARTLVAGLDARDRGPANEHIGFAVQVNGRPSTETNLSPAALERALQVPRSQRDDPGAFLLVAKNGDLLRTNLEGYDAKAGRLAVNGGAGGAHELDQDVLALAVRLESSDPVPPSGDWVVQITGGYELRGTLVSATGTEVVLEHPLLGTVTVANAGFTKLMRGYPASRYLLNVEGWETTPMPEPRLKDEGK